VMSAWRWIEWGGWGGWRVFDKALAGTSLW
jgi:hypothetical protein